MHGHRGWARWRTYAIQGASKVGVVQCHITVNAEWFSRARLQRLAFRSHQGANNDVNAMTLEELLHNQGLCECVRVK